MLSNGAYPVTGTFGMNNSVRITDIESVILKIRIEGRTFPD